MLFSDLCYFFISEDAVSVNYELTDYKFVPNLLNECMMWIEDILGSPVFKFCSVH